ncbi:DUF3857 domain-containing protein [Mucilaginibacter sp.]|uniref:DUF3857 domain-containing protein n=1 Tax=Mucilaginibacter sp. TaxID=1882438 RepID=UPI00326782F8
MKNLYLLFLLFIVAGIKSNAQSLAYGKIDTADLKLTSCDFDKGANAMILFDVGKIAYTNTEAIVMERHKRIKIFNDKATSEGNIRLEFYSAHGAENIKNIEAETINLVGNTIVVTPLDPKLIYNQKVDKERRAISFTLPNVKAGSVIEIKYTWKTTYGYNYPNWFFQGVLPNRYSKVEAHINFDYSYNIIKKLTQKTDIDTTFIAKDTRERTRIWSMSKIPGFRIEPYMHSLEDNLQGIYFKPSRGFRTWSSIANEIIVDPDFGGQLKLPLDKEAELITDANAIKDEHEKIAYVFNTVKNTMKWNEVDKWYSDDGLKKAWQSKTGNSTEINLILYHFLKLAGIKPSLLVLGTRDNGEIELGNPSFGRLNKTVVRVAIDSLNFYVMDATGKYNTYNDTPYELLGLNMVAVDPDTKNSDVIKLNTVVPSTEVVFVNASIDAAGKLEGSVQKTSSNYKRISKLKTFDNLGLKKYIEDELKEGNSNLEISGHQFSAMETDTVPLREDFNFKLELTSSDEHYIFINPNLFTGLGPNPFISETRLSDIDFIFRNVYSINGRYKVPVGYKVDALPKSLTAVMGDKSISFKRIVGEIEGVIIVNYVIIYNKTKYSREEYPGLRLFFKAVYEMLNEQIVLKKS